jgi:peptide/nickel transport system permease protein
MAWLMVTAVAVIFFNMLADIVYGWLDPRIRLG